ncbi:hypothetical protein ES706_00046 [subsurface metagenome]|nr:hypothetical protein [Hadesarchaea archaeon]
MPIEWWQREDVKSCLKWFYDKLCKSTFTLVYRKKLLPIGPAPLFRPMPLVIANDDVLKIIDDYDPRFVCFGLYVWGSQQETLGKLPTSVRVEADLDKFPYAHKDVQKIEKWCNEHTVGFLTYFTGSKGYRVCLGKAGVRTMNDIRHIVERVYVMGELANAVTLDLAPYELGWIQPPANLHRDSGLPSFIVDKIPDNHPSVFQEASAILMGKKKVYTPTTPPPDGNSFIKCIDDILEEMEDKEREELETKIMDRVERHIERILYPYPHFFPY